jgi:hypothetical protein
MDGLDAGASGKTSRRLLDLASLAAIVVRPPATVYSLLEC